VVVVVVVTVVVDVTVLAAGVGDVVVSVTVEAGGGGVVTVADDVTVVVDACVVVTVTVESGTVAVEVVWVSAGPVDVDRVVSGGVVVAGRDCVGAGRLDSVVPVVDGVVVTERVVPDTWPEPPHEATAKPNAASRHAAPTAMTARDHCCGTECSFLLDWVIVPHRGQREIRGRRPTRSSAFIPSSPRARRGARERAVARGANALRGSVSAGRGYEPGSRRGANASHVAEVRMTPRTRRQPPIPTRGNMKAQRSHRTSGVGAGR
jgi:hypothetical protein